MTRPSTEHGVSLEALNTWREATVGSLLCDAAAQWPTRAAVQWPVPSGLAALNWKQVWDRAVVGAAQLLSADSGPVVIFAPNSAGWYLSLWAAALSGRPVVPINPALTPAEVGGILDDCGAPTVLAAREYRGRNLIDVIAEMNIAGVRQLWDVEDWITSTTVEPGGARLPEVGPNDMCLIQYTSGTTGTPKGAMLSHRACVNAAATIAAALEPRGHETLCSPLALHHVGALLGHAVALACVGGTYVMLNGFAPREYVEVAATSRATVLGGVPTIYLRVLEEPALAEVELPHVRVLMLGGASIPAALVSRLEDHFDAHVAVLYGQSEAPGVTACRLDDPPWAKAGTVGHVLPHREVRIADPAGEQPVPVGDVGEICVRTPIRMERYLNLPDATAAAIDDDGWLHTGDLGALDADGMLYFHGRLREMIVRGGENIYAREIEQAIESHPGVAQVAVVGLPDPEWGETVAAAVVARANETVTADDLSAWVASRLARYKWPTRWHFADEFPLTASGKPQKFRIVEWLQESAGA